MTKEELIKKNGEWEGIVKEMMGSDLDKRKNVSQFLDSYKTDTYYDHTKEVKVLTWPEIYYELGKLATKGDNSSLWEAVRRIEGEHLRMTEDYIKIRKINEEKK